LQTSSLQFNITPSVREAALYPERQVKNVDYPLSKASFAPLSRTSNKKKVVPGTYDSVVVEINPAPGWTAGKAYEFTYRLKTNSGEAEKKEVFVNSLKNPRTAWFVDTYLKEENGVEILSLDELLGLKERLTYAYDEINGVKFLNISNREFIGFEKVSKDVEGVDNK